jgi:hypothetical protein
LDRPQLSALGERCRALGGPGILARAHRELELGLEGAQLDEVCTRPGHRCTSPLPILPLSLRRPVRCNSDPSEAQGNQAAAPSPVLKRYRARVGASGTPGKGRVGSSVGCHSDHPASLLWLRRCLRHCRCCKAASLTCRSETKAALAAAPRPPRAVRAAAMSRVRHEVQRSVPMAARCGRTWQRSTSNPPPTAPS